jgi:hypothetical protein
MEDEDNGMGKSITVAFLILASYLVIQFLIGMFII